MNNATFECHARVSLVTKSLSLMGRDFYSKIYKDAIIDYKDSFEAKRKSCSLDFRILFQMSPIHPCDTPFFVESSATSDCSTYSSKASTSSELIDSSRIGSIHKVDKCAHLISKLSLILSCKFKGNQKSDVKSEGDCELAHTSASGVDPFVSFTS